MSYKKVLFPIEVPSREYCWEWDIDKSICEYFDNEGGHPTCGLGFYPLKNGRLGVLKPEKCRTLDECIFKKGFKK